MALGRLDKTGICNLALSNIYVSQVISDITDGSPEANALAAVYDHTLRECLEECDWRFARKRATLVEDSADPPDEWGYSYGLPEDFVKAVRVIDNRKSRNDEEEIPFTTECDDDGVELLYTDMEDAELLYTYAVTNTARFTAQFANFFAWALALRIAFPLTKDRDVVRIAVDGRHLSMSRAIATNFGGERKPDPPEGGEFQTARG